MTDDDRNDTDRPRPAPRPRAAGVPGARPTPRPRVAGSRRERDEAGSASALPVASPRPRPETGAAATSTGTVSSAEPGPGSGGPQQRRSRLVPIALLLLIALAAAAVAVLVVQRVDPPHVDSAVFSSTRDNVQALYAYDYQDSEGSVQGKLDVLTGELREQYESDLAPGSGIIDTYEQVSATTSYEVLDVGLQQINQAQDTATLVVFGQYVVESVTSGQQPAPEGSECEVTPEGAQSCTQTVQVRQVLVDGEWKISELTLLTTS